ncbi:hypothetical protein GCM10011374_31600 [Kocuria dechangensis]|uniref:Alternate-type signal peptide domain-containing protein n=1 Tax=Kocuria dechangensis TaxID=1176249 RepID=A0A917LY42_9MICC|nr:hypothetical protein [Kocuria dechangensis]GGG65435.1 hypothetical protein GCM10011374_31600 [Kocuria dechangensis]
MTAPSPSRPAALLRASAASLVAVALLGSGLGTAARWSDEAALGAPAISTGALGVRLGPATAALRHTAPGTDAGTDAGATAPEDVTGSATVPGVLEGDTLAVTTRMAIEARGTNLTATLTVDPGLPDGSPLVPHVRIDPVDGAPPLGGTGAENTRTVTAAHHGASYDVTVTYHVPAGALAEGTSVDPVPLTVTLAQN